RVSVSVDKIFDRTDRGWRRWEVALCLCWTGIRRDGKPCQSGHAERGGFHEVSAACRLGSCWAAITAIGELPSRKPEGIHCSLLFVLDGGYCPRAGLCARNFSSVKSALLECPCGGRGFRQGCGFRQRPLGMHGEGERR